MKKIIIVILLFLVTIGFVQLNTTNILSDDTLTVTFIYFYDTKPPPSDWENIILADISSINMVYQQCPSLQDPRYTYYSVEEFYHKYTNLQFDWQFHDVVRITDWKGLTGDRKGTDALRIWYSQNPIEAKNVWDSSDIVFGIVDSDGMLRGGACENCGYCCLSAKSLFEYIDDYKTGLWSRQQQLELLSHELLHNFGTPDHYSSSDPGYNHPDASPLCIMGGFSTLNQDAVICKYCLDRTHWNTLTKPGDEYWLINNINNIDGYFSLNGKQIEKSGRYIVNDNQLTFEFTATEFGEFVDGVYLKDSNDIIKFDKISNSKWRLQHTTHNPFLRCYITPTFEDKKDFITDITVNYDINGNGDDNGNDIPFVSVGYFFILMGFVTLLFYKKKRI